MCSIAQNEVFLTAYSSKSQIFSRKYMRKPVLQSANVVGYFKERAVKKLQLTSVERLPPGHQVCSCPGFSQKGVNIVYICAPRLSSQARRLRNFTPLIPSRWWALMSDRPSGHKGGKGLTEKLRTGRGTNDEAYHEALEAIRCFHVFKG